MELTVFSDRRLESTNEWQRAIDAEGFPLQLDASVQLHEARGFFPMMLRGRLAGFEAYHDNADESMTYIGADKFDHRWRHALGFRWLGSNLEELQAAWMAATAYAASTGGVVFDGEEGKVMPLEQARETVRGILRDLPRIEAMMEELKRKNTKRS
jgi:hypothetical protein